MGKSFWEGTAAEVAFPSLSSDVEADVVIIGGGITGITAAQLLSRAGKRVVVLEAHQVGLGTTGYSTGNLHVVVDEYLYKVRNKWGDDVLRDVVRSRTEMVSFIERTVGEYSIDCGFVRRPHYLFATEESQFQDLEKELDAALAGGLSVEEVASAPLSVPSLRAIRVDDQAQFHPASYTRLLAKAIESDSCRIFEHSRAHEINPRENFVTTPGGARVTAEKIISATHSPKGIHFVHTALGPYREYGIAGRLSDDNYPDGIFWSLESPHHSLRSFEANGTRYFIVIGEKHKTGQHEPSEDYFGKVEAFARRHFNVASIDYRWSAQHYKPADTIPFIGHSGTQDDLYIATGFSTSGLLYGPLSAHIIAADILGGKHPSGETYRANRFTPLKSAKEFAQENVNVAAELVKDYVLRASVEKQCDVAPGEGLIASVDGKQIALHRTAEGELVALSPVCTHMGCIVHWNGFEKSWDCPCHGSRFRPTGEVLEGPAITPLHRKEVHEK